MPLRFEFFPAFFDTEQNKRQLRAGYITFGTEGSVRIAYHLFERDDGLDILHIGKICIAYVRKKIDI